MEFPRVAPSFLDSMWDILNILVVRDSRTVLKKHEGTVYVYDAKCIAININLL